MKGSSPLTRGKPIEEVRAAVAPGLIPTHAGKTETAEGIEIEARAHPHSRGENDDVLVRGFGGEGSSPLTRGKHVPRLPGRLAGGLIPTHAGKT